jgi:hypothetical protein
MTVPLALFLGLPCSGGARAVRKPRSSGHGDVLAVMFGKNVAESSYAHFFLLTKHQITIAMALYRGASILRRCGCCCASRVPARS